MENGVYPTQVTIMRIYLCKAAREQKTSLVLTAASAHIANYSLLRGLIVMHSSHNLWATACETVQFHMWPSTAEPSGKFIYRALLGI